MADIGVRTLLIEDSALVRKILGAKLQSIGCSIVGEADDPADGLQRFEERHPSIVSLDLTMPRVGGVTTEHLSQTIRRDRPEVAVIVISSSSKAANALSYLAGELLILPGIINSTHTRRARVARGESHRQVFRRSQNIADPLRTRDVAGVEMQVRAHQDSGQYQLHLEARERSADAMPRAATEREIVMRRVTRLDEAIGIEPLRLIPQIGAMMHQVDAHRDESAGGAFMLAQPHPTSQAAQREPENRRDAQDFLHRRIEVGQR